MKKKMLYTAGVAAILTAGAAMTALAGWSHDGYNWYYFHDRTGEMLEDEWVQSNGYWYHLGDDGKMDTNTIVDDLYYVDANGARVTKSWQYIYGDDWDDEDTGWRYFTSNGKMYVDGMKEIDGVGYYFEDGIMQTGWIEINDYTYYFRESGARATGWRWLTDRDEDNWGEYWYYFTSGGKLVSGKQYEIDDVVYIFDTEGRMLTGWVNPDDFTSSGTGNLSEDDPSELLYFKENGSAAEGWHYMAAADDSDDYWHYFKAGRAYAPGYKATTVGEYGMAKIDGEYYCFDENGHMVVGLIETKDGQYFFFDEDNGTMQTGRVVITNDEFDEQEFYFSTSNVIGKRGAGYTGVKDNRVYDNGLLLKAEDGMKYEVVKITVDGEARYYLVNESGKIKTSGTVTDGDGVKWKVTKSGSSYVIERVN